MLKSEAFPSVGSIVEDLYTSSIISMLTVTTANYSMYTAE